MKPQLAKGSFETKQKLVVQLVLSEIESYYKLYGGVKIVVMGFFLCSLGGNNYFHSPLSPRHNTAYLPS